MPPTSGQRDDGLMDVVVSHGTASHGGNVGEGVMDQNARNKPRGGCGVQEAQVPHIHTCLAWQGGSDAWIRRG